MPTTVILVDEPASVLQLQELPGNTIEFATTSSSPHRGPKIRQNARLFAVIDLFGFKSYFEFFTQEQADYIQLGVYNGGENSVSWRYFI